MPTTMQPSLAGGELAPTLWGRVDLAKYRVGAKLLRNFVIHPHGGVSNRSGTQFISHPYPFKNTMVILRSFVASDDSAYILEFGDQFMRPWFNGRPILAPNGQQLVISTPWFLNHIKEAKIEQSNDVMTITHRQYPIYELQHWARNDWRLAAVNFTPKQPAPTNVAATATIQFNTPPPAGQSSGFVASMHTYGVTSISDDGEESLISQSYSVSNDLGYRQNWNTITWDAVPGTQMYNVYKFDNGLWGIIGQTRRQTRSFKDMNFKADVSQGPPQGQNPFTANGVNTPGVSTYHQQRRWFASSVSQPTTIWATMSSNYDNMSKSVPLRDSDAIQFAIASQKIQKILHMVPLQDLIVFTTSGEWKITGNKDPVITPVSIAANPQSAYGAAAKPDPLVIGNQIVFVQSMGQTVRDIGYRYDIDRYTGDDLSILARHLLDPDESIIEWAYAQVPDSMIWIVTSKGRLRTLTYMREHEVWGWARHDSFNAKFESVAVVPEKETGYSAVYFVVQRQIAGSIQRSIEKLTLRNKTRELGWFVDCGLRYDPQWKTVFPALDRPNGRIVFTMQGHGLTNGTTIRFHTFLKTLEEWGIWGDYEVTDASADTFSIKSKLTGEYEPPPETNISPTGDIRFARQVSVVSGLSHLEGERVVGVVDGGVVGVDEELRVQGGTVTLPYPGAMITLGLPYTAQFQSLELMQGDQITISQFKAIKTLRVQVDSTSGLKLGRKFTDLKRIPERQFENYGEPPLLKTGLLEIAGPQGWSETGEIVAEQDYPLPCSILALVPDIEYGKN